MPFPTLSIVVPVFHEAGTVNSLIDHLRGLEGGSDLEILIVDGAPEEDSLSVLARPGVVGLTSPLGRARQMNAGAARAGGQVILFLHADTRLPDRTIPLITQTLTDPGIAGGAFDLGIDSVRTGLRLVAWAASLRSRMTRVPYGDQAIFLRRDVFQLLGGYRDLPLMEDLDLMRRLRLQGLRIAILKPAVRTSARRWEKEGLVRGTLRNWAIRILYHLGVSPSRLVRLYRPHQEP